MPEGFDPSQGGGKGERPERPRDGVEIPNVEMPPRDLEED
jgi:hypothetical protein